MRANNNKIAAVGLALCAALAGGDALAVTQTFVGTNVTYAFDDAELGLFGPLANVSVSGDSLAFAPTGFAADGLMPAYQTFNITITAHAGYELTAFNLNEGGGYTLPSLGDAAYIAGNMTAIDIEGNSSSNVVGNIVASAPLLGEAGNWSAQAGVSLPASGWGGGDGVVNQIKLTLTNQLFATGSAEIWKNAVLVEAVTTPVPEAETYAMMLAGLGLVGFMVRRRNARAL